MIKFLSRSLFISLITLGFSQEKNLEQLPLIPLDFKDPPARSMPGILWFWHQTDVTPEIIKTQIQEMKNAQVVHDNDISGQKLIK